MKKNWLLPGLLALAAAVVFLVPMADRAALHLLAPVCGVLAVLTVFHLVRLFVLNGCGRSSGPAAESRPRENAVPANLAATVAAVVFMLSPAVRSAATRFEMRLFDFTWAILIVALAVPFLRRARAAGLYATLAGAAWAAGLADSALFLAFLPFYLILVVQVARSGASRAGTAGGSSGAVLKGLVLFLASAALAFAAVAAIFHLGMGLFLRRTVFELSSYYRIPGWFFVFFFTTLPFLTVLFSEDGALGEKPRLVQLLFHVALSFVTVLAVTPPLSPSALMAPYGRLPVATSAFAAAVAGYLAAYWWTNRGLRTARAVGGILCLVLAGLSIWNLVSFDARNFPARRVVVRMDGRRAREILRKDPDSPLANYVMGSLALGQDRYAEAEAHLRKAADIREPVPFALNDLAELLRRGGKYEEAERYARQCVARAPGMYVAWETLGSVLADADRDLAEAEAAIRRACELSKGGNGRAADVRMLVSLARVQLKRGDGRNARETIGEIESRQNELPAAERAEFERLLKR